jgi:hypothetical protein
MPVWVHFAVSRSAGRCKTVAFSLPLQSLSVARIHDSVKHLHRLGVAVGGFGLARDLSSQRRGFVLS